MTVVYSGFDDYVRQRLGMERKGVDCKGGAEDKIGGGYNKTRGYKDIDDNDAESKSVASSGQEEELDEADFAQEKKLELDVESEWDEIRKRPSIPRIQKAVDVRGKKIADGLKMYVISIATFWWLFI